MRRSADALGPRAASGKRGPSPSAAQGPPPPVEANFDWAVLGWYALLVVHAVRRHWKLLACTWLVVVAASVVLLLILPKTYEVETTLQVQRPSGLSNPTDADNQTKQAANFVLSRDNLVAIVRQTDFINKWPLNRAPLLKFKDALWKRLFHKPTEDEQIDGFVGLLEKQLWATPGDGTIVIGIHLSDPQLALRVVEAALQNLLEARHTAEISSIGEVITLLEGRAAQAHIDLDQTLRVLEDLRTARAKKLGRNARASMSPALATLPDPETEQLLVQLKSKRLAMADLEDFHHRRVAELQNRLEENRTKYSDTHPAVLDSEQLLEDARPDPAQVVALRRELEPLESELKARGFDATGALKGATGRDLSLQEALKADDPREDEDPDIDYAKSQVRHAVGHYNEMLDRTASARLEQDRAGAAFKYRYVVLWPPQKPLKPFKPKAGEVVGSAVVAGLFLAIFGVALVDLTSRKVVESWQVEHALALPLLASLEPGALTPPHEGLPPATGPPETAHEPSAKITSLWFALRSRPWKSLAVVSPDSGAHAWRLTQLLVESAGEHQRPVLKAVNLLDLSLARASTVAQALAAGNFADSGERMRFVVATSSPVLAPVSLSVLGMCEGIILLLDLEHSRIPEARRLIEMVGRARMVGAVLASR